MKDSRLNKYMSMAAVFAVCSAIASYGNSNGSDITKTASKSPVSSQTGEEEKFSYKETSENHFQAETEKSLHEPVQSVNTNRF